jgi:hypothetical protein
MTTADWNSPSGRPGANPASQGGSIGCKSAVAMLICTLSMAYGCPHERSSTGPLVSIHLQDAGW